MKKNKANLTLHDLLMRAKHYYPDWNGTREDILKARELYEQALEIDSDCAAAYSGLASTYNLEYISGWSEDLETAGARAMISSPSACATQPAIAIIGLLPSGFFNRPMSE